MVLTMIRPMMKITVTNALVFSVTQPKNDILIFYILYTTVNNLQIYWSSVSVVYILKINVQAKLNTGNLCFSEFVEY